MPAEPLAVPQHEAVVAEELGAEDLRGEVGAAPAERDREHREHGCDDVTASRRAVRQPTVRATRCDVTRPRPVERLRRWRALAIDGNRLPRHAL